MGMSLSAGCSVNALLGGGGSCTAAAAVAVQFRGWLYLMLYIEECLVSRSQLAQFMYESSYILSSLWHYGLSHSASPTSTGTTAALAH